MFEKFDKSFKTAEFITCDYTPSFSKFNPWSGSKPRLYQHNDLTACDGLPMFATDFELKDTNKITLRVAALGVTEVYVNGKKITDDRMVSGWTNYNVRALYSSYDISDKVKAGKNRILAVVAPGWYCGRIAGGYYGDGTPAVKIAVECAEKTVITDKSWRCCVGGQIRTADIWDGEYRDGGLDPYEKISVVDYSLSEWKKSEEYKYKGEVTPYIGTPIRIRNGLSLRPCKITVTDGIEYNGSDYGKVHVATDFASLPLEVKRGQKVVIDFGQEIVGHLKITAKAKKGLTLKMRYSEFLNDSGAIARGNDGPEGSVYTINLRSALAKAYYVFGGENEETYRPTFTFFGFRFVELSADGDYTISDLLGEIVGNDNRETGSVRTSSELVNKLISNALWGQRGNYLSVPTDCPQRDERLGWTGDAQAFSITAAYNADVYGFFRKWMQDMRDSQGKNGAYADVNPRVGCCHGENACAWGDAGIIIPYNMYVIYGDTTMLEEHFDSMDRYIENLKVSGAEPRYGDWLAYDWCENEFISSAYYVHDIDLMIYMAGVLGKEEKIERYKKLREKAYGYFTKNFMTKGKLREQTQCNKVIALAFDLLDEEYAKKVADELEQQIKSNGNKLSTGFLGTYNLCPVLSKYGKDNLAYTLLLQREEPSWLYSVDQGATTIWERWNSYTLAKGFGDVGMNSFNHYAYGAVVDWMYRYMAGIQPAEPGFGKVLLAPRVDTRTGSELPQGQENIKFAEAKFDSVKGTIYSGWQLEDDKFTYNCAVPEGTEAMLELPVFADKAVIDGEEHAISKDADGVAKIALTAGQHTVIQYTVR